MSKQRQQQQQQSSSKNNNNKQRSSNRSRRNNDESYMGVNRVKREDDHVAHKSNIDKSVIKQPLVNVNNVVKQHSHDDVIKHHTQTTNFPGYNYIYMFASYDGVSISKSEIHKSIIDVGLMYGITSDIVINYIDIEEQRPYCYIYLSNSNLGKLILDANYAPIVNVNGSNRRLTLSKLTVKDFSSEESRDTLICRSMPSHITEDDVKVYFSMFNFIVNIKCQRGNILLVIFPNKSEYDLRYPLLFSRKTIIESEKKGSTPMEFAFYKIGGSGGRNGGGSCFNRNTGSSNNNNMVLPLPQPSPMNITTKSWLEYTLEDDIKPVNKTTSTSSTTTNGGTQNKRNNTTTSSNKSRSSNRGNSSSKREFRRKD